MAVEEVADLLVGPLRAGEAGLCGLPGVIAGADVGGGERQGAAGGLDFLERGIELTARALDREPPADAVEVAGVDARQKDVLPKVFEQLAPGQVGELGGGLEARHLRLR